MENWAVYCKADISSAPLLLMEGSKEDCIQSLSDTQKRYAEKPNFAIERYPGISANQFTVTDMQSLATYPTKFYFIAPKG